MSKNGRRPPYERRQSQEMGKDMGWGVWQVMVAWKGTTVHWSGTSTSKGEERSWGTNRPNPNTGPPVHKKMKQKGSGGISASLPVRRVSCSEDKGEKEKGQEKTAVQGVWEISRNSKENEFLLDLFVQRLQPWHAKYIFFLDSFACFDRKQMQVKVLLIFL